MIVAHRIALSVLVGLAAAFIVSVVSAQAQSGSAPPGLTEAPEFYARVAAVFGMDQGVLQPLVPEFKREGVDTRDAVLLIIFGHKRTLRVLREEKITKEQLPAAFRESIVALLQTRKARTDWKTFTCDQLGVDLYAMLK